MERIWIAGNSGSGKTTLVNLISEKLGIPVFHRDYISWHEDFTMRTDNVLEDKMLKPFIKKTPKKLYSIQSQSKAC